MFEGKIDLQVDVAVAAPPKLKGGSDGKEGPDDGAVVFASAGLVPNRLFVVEVVDAAAASGLGPNRPPAEVEAAAAGVVAPDESLLAKSPPPKRFAWAGAVVVVVVEGAVLGGLGRFAKRPPAAGVPADVIEMQDYSLKKISLLVDDVAAG